MEGSHPALERRARPARILPARTAGGESRKGAHLVTRRNTEPDWNVAFFDGQPEVVVNLPAVALLMKNAPCGFEEATRRMHRSLPPDIFAELSELLKEDPS